MTEYFIQWWTIMADRGWSVGTHVHADALACITALLATDAQAFLRFYVLAGSKPLLRRLSFLPATTLTVPSTGSANRLLGPEVGWLSGCNLTRLHLSPRNAARHIADHASCLPPDSVLPHLRTLHADKHWLLEFAPAALRSVAIDSHTRDFPLSSIDDLLLPARHYERGLSDVFPSLEEVCVIVAHKMDSVYIRQDAPVSVTPGCANSLSLLTHDLRQFEALNWLRTTCPASLRHLDMRVYFVAPFVERLARLCGHTSLDNRLVRQLYHFGLTTVVPPCGPRSVVLAVTRELDHPLLTGSGPTARALLERMQLPPPLLPTSLQSVALSLSPASLAFTLLPWVRCADAACASDEEPCLFIALHAEASSRYAQPLSAAALAFGALLAPVTPERCHLRVCDDDGLVIGNAATELVLSKAICTKSLTIVSDSLTVISDSRVRLVEDGPGALGVHSADTTLRLSEECASPCLAFVALLRAEQHALARVGLNTATLDTVCRQRSVMPDRDGRWPSFRPPPDCAACARRMHCARGGLCALAPPAGPGRLFVRRPARHLGVRGEHGRRGRGLRRRAGCALYARRHHASGGAYSTPCVRATRAAACST